MLTVDFDKLGVEPGDRVLDMGCGAVGDLVLRAHRGEHVRHRGELVGVLVERDDVGAAAVELERVPPGAAAHVEDAVTRLHAEPVEVHGQHQASLFSLIACW